MSNLLNGLLGGSEASQTPVGNITSDTVTVVSNLLGNEGVPNPLGDAVVNTNAAVQQTGQFVNNVADDLSPDAGLTNQPLDATANSVTQDFHLLLEGLSHDTGTGKTVHGLTNLGNTAGVSNLGGDNLVTDTIQAPSDLLTHNANPSQVVDGILQDAGNTLDAVPKLVNGPTTDVHNDLTQGGLLGNDTLHFPNLGGEGSDSLLGLVSLSGVNNTGSILGAIGTGDQSQPLIDIHRWVDRLLVAR